MASSVESCPSITLPKMVYFESRCGCLAYAMKNWDLLVSGPEFAIATTPRALNCQGMDDEHRRQGYQRPPSGAEKWMWNSTFRVDRISSGKGLPQIDWPPFPVPVGSPAWVMKPLMFL